MNAAELREQPLGVGRVGRDDDERRRRPCRRCGVTAMPVSPIQPTAASKPPMSLRASSTCSTPSLSDGSRGEQVLEPLEPAPKSWASTSATCRPGRATGASTRRWSPGRAWRCAGGAVSTTKRAVLGADRAWRARPGTGRRGRPARPGPRRRRRPRAALAAADDERLDVDVGEREPVAGDGRRGGLELGVGVEALLAAGVDRGLDRGQVADGEDGADDRVGGADLVGHGARVGAAAGSRVIVTPL